MGLEKFGVRTLVSVIFGPLIILSAWQGGLVFLALVISLVVLAMLEFYHMATQKFTHPNKYIGVGTGVLLLLMFYYQKTEYLLLLLTIAFLCLLIIELFRNEIAPILNVSNTLGGVFYVALLLGFLILVREFPLGPLGYHYGGYIVILMFLAVWICDSTAYILGSRLGRHKLFPRVSPNKTIEGTVFGFAFAILTAYLCYLFFLKKLGLVHVLTIGAICGSVGQVSDLIESLFKRDANVKDSSNIIPGHGGILDRFDSEMLVAPVVYLYLRFVIF